MVVYILQLWYFTHDIIVNFKNRIFSKPILKMKVVVQTFSHQITRKKRFLLLVDFQVH